MRSDKLGVLATMGNNQTGLSRLDLTLALLAVAMILYVLAFGVGPNF